MKIKSIVFFNFRILDLWRLFCLYFMLFLNLWLFLLLLRFLLWMNLLLLSFVLDLVFSFIMFFSMNFAFNVLSQIAYCIFSHYLLFRFFFYSDFWLRLWSSIDRLWRLNILKLKLSDDLLSVCFLFCSIYCVPFLLNNLIDLFHWSVRVLCQYLRSQFRRKMFINNGLINLTNSGMLFLTFYIVHSFFNAIDSCQSRRISTLLSILICLSFLFFPFLNLFVIIFK